MRMNVTGHRPEKLPNTTRLQSEIEAVLSELGVSHLIQGMAAGVDLMSAVAAFNVGIPYTCARPWAGHKPRNADKELYGKVLLHAAEVVDVDPSEKYPGAWVYQKRNEWMVDNAEGTLAVWDGTTGGTFNCVQYAVKLDRPIYVVNPNTYEGKWLTEK